MQFLILYTSVVCTYLGLVLQQKHTHSQFNTGLITMAADVFVMDTIKTSENRN